MTYVPIIGKKEALTLGPELLTDGGFELWDDPNDPTSWTVFDTQGTTAVVARESTIKVTGNYSISFTFDGSNQKIAYQVVNSLTPGDNYLFTCKYRNATGALGGEPLYLAFDDDPGTATQMYDFVTDEWVAMGSPGEDNSVTATGTATFTDFPGIVIPAPASGKMCVIVGATPSFGGGGGPFTVYIDDASFKEVTSAPEDITVLDISSPTDYEDMGDGDYYERLKTTGGVDFNARSLDYTGAYTTDFANFDFSTDGIRTKQVLADIADPPTITNLNSAFGTAAEMGDGFTAVIRDNSGGTKAYLCTVINGVWFYEELTAAA